MNIKKKNFIFCLVGMFVFACLFTCGVFAAVASSINFSLVMKLNPTIYFALDLQIDENGDGEFTTASELKIHRIFDNTPENGTHASWAIVNMSRIVLQNTGLAENPFTGLTNSAVFKITVTNLTTAEQQGVEENSPELKNLWLSLNPAQFSGMYTLPESGVQNVAYGTSKSIVVYPDTIASEYFEIPFKVELKTVTYDHNIVFNIAEDACPVNDNVEIKWPTPDATVANGYDFSSKLISDYDVIVIESVTLNGVNLDFTFTNQTKLLTVAGEQLEDNSNLPIIINVSKVGYMLITGSSINSLLNNGASIGHGNDGMAPPNKTLLTCTFDLYSEQSANIAGYSTVAVGVGDNADKILLYRDASMPTYAYFLSEYNIFTNYNCYQMFSFYYSLNTINLNNFDTYYTTSFSWMFSWMKAEFLTINKFENINTENATTIAQMFWQNSALDYIDVSNFKTEKTTSMYYLFTYCHIRELVGLDNLDTSNVVDMGGMFYSCTGLTSLDLSNFDTSNVVDMSNMFYNCSGLTTLDLSNFDTSNVTNMSYMFYGCTGLGANGGTLDISNFNTSRVTNMSYMFDDCNQLTLLDVSSFNTSSVTTMEYMFYKCTGLTSLDLSTFNTSKVTNMVYMFYGCSGLTSLDLSHFNTSNVTNMSYMFRLCTSLLSLDITSFNTSKVTNMQDMFSRCDLLETIDVSKFDTSNVVNMYAMFCDDYKLKFLNLSSFNTTKSTNMYGMFCRCYALKTIYVSENFVTTNVADSFSMFYGCTALVGGNGTAYNANYLDKTYARIDIAGAPGYFTKWVG